MQNVTWPIYKRLLQRSKRPILVGPFKSELGFEALYWIPFVQSLGLAPERIIPVTRGGAAYWYGSPSGVEIYDLRDPKDVRIENILQHMKTGMLKQNAITPFDRALLTDAAKAVGLSKYHVLHPSIMYTLLRPFWTGVRGFDWVLPYLTKLEKKEGQWVRSLTNLRAPAVPEGLPKNYCVARFYARTTLPNADITQQLARECLTQVAAHQPVILLNPSVHADEHIDLPVKDLPNVFKLSDLIQTTPRDNLLAQSAVIAGATGFIGTYGGVAQLALRLGKPSVSFYLEWKGTALAHKQLSETISLQTGVSFLTVKLMDIPLLKAVAPDLVLQHASSSQQRRPQQPAPEVSTHVEAPA